MHFGIATNDIYTYASIRKMNRRMRFIFESYFVFTNMSAFIIKRHGESNTGHIKLVIYTTIQEISVPFVDILIDIY